MTSSPLNADKGRETQIAAMPLRFDPETNNVYNSEGVALARFRHASQGEAVVRACNSHERLLNSLRILSDVSHFKDMQAMAEFARIASTALSHTRSTP